MKTERTRKSNLSTKFYKRLKNGVVIENVLNQREFENMENLRCCRGRYKSQNVSYAMSLLSLLNLLKCTHVCAIGVTTFVIGTRKAYMCSVERRLLDKLKNAKQHSKC